MSSPCSTEYDVFISFRGEDTRETFTVHLFNALESKGIQTYMDCRLERGESVWPALEKAIESSLMSIVVFSENYADSKWCLEELGKIIQWKKDHRQFVIPVFYRTDPTDIRNQTGSYEKAFAKHERDLAESESMGHNIRKWRQALKISANISGWHSRHYRDDHELIRNVVNDVLKLRTLKHPIVPTGLVGIKEIYRSVKFHVKQHGVIGIWGMRGIGKTTIAKMLFAKYFPHYDHVCYAEDAKEYTPQRLLSELLRREISTDVTGFINRMGSLNKKRVLIVLDHVTKDFDQTLLEAVCQVYRNYSRESKLIITTRCRQLLVDRVDYIYDVQPWKNSKSIELLCLSAFRKSVPPESFKSLVDKVVMYAEGNPLALYLLGSDLRTKGQDFWVSTLEKLQKHYSTQVIYDAFRNIYDELEELEKEIFLDIAFFFHGEEKDLVTSILKACDFSPVRGIEVLQDKALIAHKETIKMHNLLRKIAFKIVLMENSKDPKKRSRLNNTEHIRDVLEENKETLDSEGIILDLSQIKEDLHLSPDTFKRMKKLRFLKFYIPSGQSSGKMILTKDLEPFSGKLRYFEWHQYPFKSLPPSFCAKLLVEIRMPHSQVKKLWLEKQELDNLEGIDLSECKELEELPDLSKAKRLRWVNLSGCESLAILNSSVFSSNTLVSLILDRCTKLQCVKAERHLNSLQHISVKGCSILEKFAVSSDLIENLDLSNTNVEKLDRSIGKLLKLECLNLEGSRVKHLPKELSALKLLKELKHSYSGLEIDKQQLQDLFNGLQSLRILHLKDCRKPFELPNNIDALSKLHELRLDGSNVTKLPATIKRLQELEILSLNNCSSLETLPGIPFSIKDLSANNCTLLSNSLNLLAGHTLYSIMERIYSKMMNAVSSNVRVQIYSTDVHGYNYNSLEVRLPGDTIPEQFAYKTKKSSSIAIELPDSPTNFLGFIYSMVLSPRHGMKKHSAKIRCQYKFAGGMNYSWEDITISELNSDHLFIWYDPCHTDKILGQDEPSFHLEFRVVATDTGKVDDSIIIKECGVQIIHESELQRFSLELDKKKKDMGEESSKQQLHPLHGSQDHSRVQTPHQDMKKISFDEKQNNDIENQTSKKQTEINKQSSSDRKIEGKMESAPNENNTSDGNIHEENIANGMEEVKDYTSNVHAKKQQELRNEKWIVPAQPINSSTPSHGVKVAPKSTIKDLRRHLKKVDKKAKLDKGNPANQARNLAMETSHSSHSMIKGKTVEDVHYLNHIQTQNACTSIAQTHGKIIIPFLDDHQVSLEFMKHLDTLAKHFQEFVDNHVVYPYPYDHSVRNDLDVLALCRWLQVQGLCSASVARYVEMKFEATKWEREEELRLAREENAKVKERVSQLEKRVEDLNTEVACWRSKYEETQKKLEDENREWQEKESSWETRESELMKEVATEFTVNSFENCRSQVSCLYPNIDLSRTGYLKEVRNGEIVSPSDSEGSESDEDTNNFEDCVHGTVSRKLLISFCCLPIIWFRRFKFCQ